MIFFCMWIFDIGSSVLPPPSLHLTVYVVSSSFSAVFPSSGRGSDWTPVMMMMIRFLVVIFSFLESNRGRVEPVLTVDWVRFLQSFTVSDRLIRQRMSGGDRGQRSTNVRRQVQQNGAHLEPEPGLEPGGLVWRWKTNPTENTRHVHEASETNIQQMNR